MLGSHLGGYRYGTVPTPAAKLRCSIAVTQGCHRFLMTPHSSKNAVCFRLREIAWCKSTMRFPILLHETQAQQPIQMSGPQCLCKWGC